MAQSELEGQFVQGLRLLYSSNKDSADQLKTLLDEVLKKNYGSSKMLCNTLSKKYIMEEQVLSDNGSSSSKKSKSSSSSKHSVKSSKNNSPITIQEPSETLANDDHVSLEFLEDDLTCVVCKGMDVSASNRLVECTDCHSLYHQECHAPAILDSQVDDPRRVWYCVLCFKNQQPKEKSPPKPAVESKSKESKKSSSSHKEKYKSSSSNSSQNPSSNGNNSKVPSINIISAADRRLKDMMKKAKQDKRSSSGSSKHSSSSSSKSSHDKSYKNKSSSE